MNIFAEPTYREPRGKSFIGWAVCGDLTDGSRKLFKTEAEAKAFRETQTNAGREAIHGMIEIREGGVWEWEPRA